MYEIIQVLMLPTHRESNHSFAPSQSVYRKIFNLIVHWIIQENCNFGRYQRNMKYDYVNSHETFHKEVIHSIKVEWYCLSLVESSVAQMQDKQCLTDFCANYDVMNFFNAKSSSLISTYYSTCVGYMLNSNQNFIRY